MDSSQRIHDKWIAFGIWIAMLTSVLVTSQFILNAAANLFLYIGEFRGLMLSGNDVVLIYSALVIISLILLVLTWIHLSSTTNDLLVQFASSDLGNETVFHGFLEFEPGSEDDQDDPVLEGNIEYVAKTTLPGKFIVLLGLTWLVFLLTFPAYALLSG